MHTWANNMLTTLSAGITASATSMTVASMGDLVLGVNETAFLTLQNDAASLYEIVKVTEISGLTLTIQRAQEGTTAQAWEVGAIVVAAQTKSQLIEIRDGIARIKKQMWFQVTGSAVSSVNGQKQYLQAASAMALTIDLQDGEDMVLEINPATFNVTLPSISWRGSVLTWFENKWHTLTLSKRGSSLICWWEVEP
ncbi:hypothetical protein ADP71_31900 [Vitreoscilla sp. C1]|uniref:hypothetical protein n=1 Tax=Vitreoscilla sp. (strain C1) TaxID=96942 RepID=UPI000CDBBB5C|nr:hypothetical protein [Vitreoscilla sp. C1]AUZ06368.1 hypothetical protein ADP71_31900 [Vitreoscilla sp. C1]